MANTTNFNWETPDDTDLVKDGAAAMRTLGNSIDISFVDLKGGTTGQILSKASNTDLDYTWVTTDDANAIQNAIVDAKGDLIAASANDTPARLAVGANGETLVGDSSTSTGLRYQTGVSLNCAINGAYDIWQRGTSSTGIGTAKTFLADRWFANSGGAGTTFAYTQSTSVPTGFQYATKIQRTAANTGTNTIYFQQDIETKDSIPFAGQTVTISLYAKAGANFSSASNALSINLVSGTGTDQSQYFAFLTGQANVATGTATLTTSYQRFTFTGTVSSSATQLGININYTPVGTAGADDSFFITGVQVERGSVATTFKRSMGTIQGELAACQRYYQLLASGLNKFLAVASVYSASQLDLLISFPEMRIAPNLVATSGTGYYTLIRNGGGDNFNSLTLNGYTTTRGAALYNNTEISSTAGNAGWVYTDNASASVALSAEL
jgi:hypothetical protein